MKKKGKLSTYIVKIKKILESLREYKKPSILSPIFVGCEVILECLIPYFTGELIDELNVINDLGQAAPDIMPTVVKYVGILLPLALGSLFFGLMAGYFAASAGVGFSKNLRHDMFKKIQTYSFENIDKYATSGLVTRITTDVWYNQNAYMNIIRIAVRAPLMVIFSLVMAFIKAPSIAWTFLILLPIVGFVLFFVVAKAHPIFENVFNKYDALNDSIEETIRGIRVVKTFVREDHVYDKFLEKNHDVRNNFIKGEKIVAFSQPSLQLGIYTLVMILTYVGGYYVLRGINIGDNSALTIGSLNACLAYGIQCLFSLLMLSNVIISIAMATASWDRIYEILVEEPTITNNENPIFEIPNGDVEFENVSFKYSASAEKFALSNVNLKIKSGETIGIIGSTGSSKSTLVNLLSRLYDVTEGSVKVGGIDVRDYDIASLRDAVSVVLQKNVVFSGTIKENLKWGNPDATDEEIEHICKMTCCDEFINNYPNRLDRVIEQGGTNVSGGQKQRLCIARALLKHPKILILDDSTSAVDTKTDAKIRKSFREYIPEVTKFIIAQRISSVQDSDRIIVMEDGHIDQVGTHDELLKTNKIYQECYYSQMKNGGLQDYEKELAK